MFSKAAPPCRPVVSDRASEQRFDRRRHGADDYRHGTRAHVTPEIEGDRSFRER